MHLSTAFGWERCRALSVLQGTAVFLQVAVGSGGGASGPASGHLSWPPVLATWSGLSPICARLPPAVTVLLL